MSGDVMGTSQVPIDPTEGGATVGSTTEYPDYSGFKLFQALWENRGWELVAYPIFFFFSVMGNCILLIHLYKKGSVRTISNAFLLNSAISDLLLAIVCMPFSLVGHVLDEFIFGDTVCKIIPFIEGISIVSIVWTLVALSVERYYVICYPLRSRQWQTTSHATKIVIIIWISGGLIYSPQLFLNKITETPEGRRQCTTSWLIDKTVGGYNFFAGAYLFFFPGIVLVHTYYRIAKILGAKCTRVRVDQSEQGGPNVQETSFTENI